MTVLDDDLDLAHRIVDAAAAVSIGHFEAGVVASTKGDGSPVTAADFEVEAFVVEQLAHARPTDGVLSEEAGAIGDHTTRRWILDPIDGTVSFAAGRPAWATQLALEVDGEVVLGVVDCPALGRRYWAARGRGAFRSDHAPTRRAEPTRLAVSAVASLPGARVGARAPRGADESARANALRASCVWTEPTLNYSVDLVTGLVEIVLFEDFGGPWDHAPWVVITEEAGGAFCDLDGGRRIDTRHFLYANRAVFDAARALLGIGA